MQPRDLNGEHQVTFYFIYFGGAKKEMKWTYAYPKQGTFYCFDTNFANVNDSYWKRIWRKKRLIITMEIKTFRVNNAELKKIQF